MTLLAFLLGATGTAAGIAADNPALTICGFWVLLVAFGLLLHRDYQANAAVAHRPAPAHWDTLDDLLALPTAARGSYPEEENV